VARAERLVGVGVFVVIGLTLFAVGLFMIGDRQLAFAKKFTIYTEFQKITGLQPGAVIRVSGAKAGSVAQIVPPTRPSDKFKVKLEVAEELHPIVRSDSVATIQTEGLVGGSFLAIDAGSDSAPPAPPGSSIPSREPLTIADLVQQMSDAISKVNGTIDLLQGDVLRAVENIADTVENANELISSVSDDIETIASAGAAITRNARDISEAIRSGKGTLGRLVNDDELYQRAAAVARNAEDISTKTREVVEQARNTLNDLESKNGPVQGLSTSLRMTLEDARNAMAGFAENMEALKRNFFFRGYFNDRGYFSLAEISPAQYREGVLTNKGSRQPVRVWLTAAVLFENDPDDPRAERLKPDAAPRLDSAVAPYLDRLPDGVLMVEGYAQGGMRDERYVRSRARASLVREYLIGKFHLDPQSTGVMPLGADSHDSPDGIPWDGIALAAFVEHAANGSHK